MNESDPLFNLPRSPRKVAQFEAQKEKLAALTEQARLQVLAGEEGHERALPILLHGKGPVQSTMPYVEKPWHRNAAMLFAAGYPCKAISEQCDVGLVQVYSLLKRPEFMANVTSLQESHGFTNVLENFKGEIAASFAKLLEIRDDEKTPKKLCADVCFGIIERGLGKTTQKIEHSGQVSSGDPVTELQRLETMNAQMRGGVN